MRLISSVTKKAVYLLSLIGILFAVTVYPPYSIIFGKTFIQFEQIFCTIFLILLPVSAIFDDWSSKEWKDKAVYAFALSALLIPLLLDIEFRSVLTDGYGFAMTFSLFLPFIVCRKKNGTAAFILLIVWGLACLTMLWFALRGRLDFLAALRVLALPCVLACSFSVSFAESRIYLLSLLPTVPMMIYLWIDVFA